MKDLMKKNFKIPLKDIKGDLNKTEKHTLFLDRKPQYCKGVNSSKISL